MELPAWSTLKNAVGLSISRTAPMSIDEKSRSIVCGNALQNYATTAPIGDCNMGCAGNSTEACGGSNRLTIFENQAIIPDNDPGPAGWTLIGCYT